MTDTPNNVLDDPRHLALIETSRQVVVLDELDGGDAVLRIHPHDTGPRGVDCEHAVLDPAARRALAAALDPAPGEESVQQLRAPAPVERENDRYRREGWHELGREVPTAPLGGGQATVTLTGTVEAESANALDDLMDDLRELASVHAALDDVQVEAGPGPRDQAARRRLESRASPGEEGARFDWNATAYVCERRSSPTAEPCHHPANHPGPCSWDAGGGDLAALSAEDGDDERPDAPPEWCGLCGAPWRSPPAGPCEGHPPAPASSAGEGSGQ